MSNEAVLKALFPVKDDEVTFARAIQIAVKIEESARVAKETVRQTPHPVQAIQTRGKQRNAASGPEGGQRSNLAEPTERRGVGATAGGKPAGAGLSAGSCWSCGSKQHARSDCRFRNAVCNFC